MKKFFLSVALAASAVCVSAVNPLWLRDAAISPDGKSIAFTYKGDIYTVPTKGGNAIRLTSMPSYETSPVWNPSGTKIAFASDREGGYDVFIMDAAGGEAVRLTSNSADEIPVSFTPDGADVVYTAAIQAPAASRTFPSGRYGQLYKVSVTGGRPSQILGTPARTISYLPDGESFVYQDIKGVEDEWRKHHTSSVTRDIWRYDASTGRHTNLTARGGEDTNPVMGGDGDTVYFLSERDGGSSNVCSFRLSDPSRVVALTRFERHPVRFLSRATDGTLAFVYDGELYTMDERGGSPAKVEVGITLDTGETAVHRKFSSGAESPVPSPDGKQVAFASRGDIFVTSADYPTTRQVTATPQNESRPSWGADNRSLYYASDRDGVSNIYRARLSRKDDPDFPNATLIEETALFPASDGIDRRNPLVSPNGQLIAYIQDRQKIAVMDLTTRKVTILTQGETYTARDGEIMLDWSPDSEWLAATIDVHQRDPYYDIAVFNIGTGEMTNITNDAYINLSPRWVMGGNAIAFISERYGMKNHASWGSTYDVLLAFTNREAYDRYRLSPEDFAILKEVEKAAKKSDTPEKDDKKGKKGKKGKKTEETPEEKPEDAVNGETEGIHERIVRLTPFSSEVADAWIDPDGENLYFLAEVEDGLDLWKMNMRKKDISVEKKLGASELALLPDGAGKNLFILGPKMMKRYAVSGGKTDNITYNARQKIDPVAEREYLFDYMVREEKERYLVKDMFGTDWDGLARDYRRFIPHISNNYDFAELASELLGELNVSHTGCRYYTPQYASEPTASLGLLYDMAYDGPGLKVAEVVDKGPFDRASSRLRAGAVITAIDGLSLDGMAEPLSALNSHIGRKTLVAFTLPGGEKVEEVVLPVSSGAMNELMYRRWVERNRALVDSLSGGRLGYVHLRTMSDDSYREIYADVLGRYAGREGIVIDTRFNGGGRLHEDIEVLFSGRKYLTQEIRGVKSGEMPSRRWLRPSIMITGEHNYSNAHGTPWMYRHMGLGKIVGMPVPGTMSSVNWVEMQDPSLVFGIPVVGFRTAEGDFLENSQLEPDVKVANDPALIVRGIDSQIETAVKTLLKDIDNK